MITEEEEVLLVLVVPLSIAVQTVRNQSESEGETGIVSRITSMQCIMSDSSVPHMVSLVANDSDSVFSRTDRFFVETAADL